MAIKREQSECVMSYRPIALLPFLLAQCSGPNEDAASLGISQKTGLSWQQSHITPGQAITVGSPSGLLTLIVDASDEMQTVSLEKPISVPVSQVTAPAAIGAHPSKLYFYINDGGGSGQFSNFTAYHVSDKGLIRLEIADKIKSRFRSVTGCAIDPEFISIGGQAWAHDDADVIVVVEHLDRRSSCDTSGAAAMRVDASKGIIENVYSRSEFRRQFCGADEVKEQIGICSTSDV